MFDRNRRAAEQPCLELMAGRAIGAVIVEQGEPRLLLALRREGQMTDGAHINLPTPIKGANARQQITERENRSEENTSELQSLMRISYAVFCLKKTTSQPPTVREETNKKT